MLGVFGIICGSMKKKILTDSLWVKWGLSGKILDPNKSRFDFDTQWRVCGKGNFGKSV